MYLKYFDNFTMNSEVTINVLGIIERPNIVFYYIANK